LKQFTNPEMPGSVGFANLPNQVHRKSVKKGFEFTLMVVGNDKAIVFHVINSKDFYFESIRRNWAWQVNTSQQFILD
jgi:hypothetical protein